MSPKIYTQEFKEAVVKYYERIFSETRLLQGFFGDFSIFF